MEFNAKNFLANVSNHPGVYQMLGAKGEVLYVGKANNLKKRLSSYFKKNTDIKTQFLVKQIRDITLTITRNENEALLLECNLIKKLKPRYNILFRDDKSYPYILITTDQPYPRIDFYRGERKRGGTYFGPYPDAGAVRETINLIEKLFQLRTCADHFFAGRSRPCLLHQLGRCSGSCTGLITEEDYRQNVQHAILFLQGKNDEIMQDLHEKMEVAAKQLNYELAKKYRDLITKLRTIQEQQFVSGAHGDVDVIGFAESAGVVCLQLLTIRGGRILGSRAYFPTIPGEVLPSEVLTSFISQHYFSQQELPKEIIITHLLAEKKWLESALSERKKSHVTIAHAVRSEKKKWLEMAVKSAKQSLVNHLVSHANLMMRFKALQKELSLSVLPKRIECFDVSHSMGEATVASCVVFDQQGAIKQDYRRFNIADVTPGDDIAAMKQALLRRYQRLQKEQTKMPDILLIDGGIAQFHVAEQVLKSLDITSILLIAVAKGVTRKPGFETLHLSERAPIHLASDSLALHLIQQIRDEAHRFAITGHRLQRDKKRRTSTLENIPGIGAKRRRDLLRYFGGLQAIQRASIDDLAKVPGISQALAARIFAVLHDVMI